MTFDLRAWSLATACATVLLAGCGEDETASSPPLEFSPGGRCRRAPRQRRRQPAAGFPPRIPVQAPPAATAQAAAPAAPQRGDRVTCRPFRRRSLSARKWSANRMPTASRRSCGPSVSSPMTAASATATMWRTIPTDRPSFREDTARGNAMGRGSTGTRMVKLAKTVTYNNGKLEGQWDELREDGSKQSSCGYQDGRRHGTWRSYDESGTKVMNEQLYSAGLHDGTWTVLVPVGCEAVGTTLSRRQGGWETNAGTNAGLEINFATATARNRPGGTNRAQTAVEADFRRRQTRMASRSDGTTEGNQGDRKLEYRDGEARRAAQPSIRS